MTLETSFAQSPYGDQCTSRYGKMGNQRRASCFATLMQNESNCDVAHFTTYESNLSCNKSGSQVACVQTPPTPQKKSGRVTSVNLLCKSCSGIHLHKLLFFLFSLWQLKRRWKTNTTLNSSTTRTQLLFFSEGRGRLYAGYSDGHGLKVEKVEPTFSSFDAMPAKITKKDHP